MASRVGGLYALPGSLSVSGRWNLTSPGQSDLSLEPAAGGRWAQTLALLLLLPWFWISQRLRHSVFSSLHLHLASRSNQNALSLMFLRNGSEKVLVNPLRDRDFKRSDIPATTCLFRSATPPPKKISAWNLTHDILRKKKDFELSLYLPSLSQCGGSRTHSSNCSCNPAPD